MLFPHAPGRHGPHVLYIGSLDGFVKLSPKFFGEPDQHFLVD